MRPPPPRVKFFCFFVSIGPKTPTLTTQKILFSIIYLSNDRTAALSARQLERMRFELASRVTDEDSLLFVGLCDGCVARIEAKNRPEDWDFDDDEGFRIL